MDHDATGADDRVISDCDRTDQHAVAADIHTVTDHRTVGCGPAHPDRRALA